MSGTYEGWINRETWWVAQFIDNNQTVYDFVTSSVAGLVSAQGLTVANYKNVQAFLVKYVNNTLLQSRHNRTGLMDSFIANILAEYEGAIDYAELVQHYLAKYKEQKNS